MCKIVRDGLNMSFYQTIAERKKPTYKRIGEYMHKKILESHAT